MTVINTQGADGNLADLDKYILKALLKSKIQTFQVRFIKD